MQTATFINATIALET